MHQWWNRYTRWSKKPAPIMGLRVRISPNAPTLMMESVDIPDSESGALKHVGSSPTQGTKINNMH